MLAEDTNDLLGSIVGGGDVLAFNGVNQSGPVTFQESEDGFGLWGLVDKYLSLGQDLVVAALGGAFGSGLEDVVDFLSEGFHFRMGLGVICAIYRFEVFVEFL